MGVLLRGRILSTGKWRSSFQTMVNMDSYAQLEFFPFSRLDSHSIATQLPSFIPQVRSVATLLIRQRRAVYDRTYSYPTSIRIVD
jgi:type IV secretory pathway TrbF-like protein